jgi:hypothetical protein
MFSGGTGREDGGKRDEEKGSAHDVGKMLPQLCPATMPVFKA